MFYDSHTKVAQFRENEMSVVKKEATVTLRTTSGRKAVYREVAADEGMRLSEWLRVLADRRVTQQRTQEVENLLVATNPR